MTARHLTTFGEADDLGPYELARLWGDPLTWPALDRTAADELSELAVMSALRAWLQRWQPIHIHRALLAGAEVAEVCAAMDAPPEEVAEVWRRWVDGQRRLVIGGRPGVSEHEYRTVAERLGIPHHRTERTQP